MAGFVDEASVCATGGAGGAGAVSFRREAHVPKGGPDGGDGGGGGDVWLVADPEVASLSAFKDHPHRRAAKGTHGMGKNRHGANAPDIVLKVPVGTQVLEEDKETIVERTIQGLINAGLIKEEDRKDIVSTWLFDAKYSYPTPTVDRDGILAQVIPFLENELSIYSRGRFGMWKYEVANTDHSLMQGVELVNRLVLGEPEKTIGIKYESTLDGRNAASHERSHLAGSGDPKKMAELAALQVDRAVPKAVVGDVDEVDVSEEELGVTTPRASKK